MTPSGCFTRCRKRAHLAGPVLAAIADSSLAAGDGQTLKVPFPGGIAILGWPEDSTIAVVKTVLPEATSWAENSSRVAERSKLTASPL